MSENDDQVVKEIVRALRDACSSFDESGVEDATSRLISHIRARPNPVPEADAVVALKLLRRRRRFELMEQLGDALMLAGQDAAEVRRQYAQSQLDQGNISSAIQVLEQVREDSAADGEHPNPDEHREAAGLLGRAYKQQYVDAGHPDIARNRDCLEKAVDCYASVFDADDSNLWHGVNTFALLARAVRDGVPIGDRTQGRAQSLGEQLGELLKDRRAAGELKLWDAATGVELHYGLSTIAETETERTGHLDAASEYLKLYTEDTNVDAFELASTRRQLAEVWELEADSVDGTTILQTLDTALLQVRGGAISGSAKEIQAILANDGLEKVFGDTGVFHARWIEQCLDRLNAVCRLRTAGGTSLGTGFLIDGQALSPALAGKPLVLTNNHVLKTTKDGKLWPANVQVHFETNDLEATVAGIAWESPVHELDASLVQLASANIDLCSAVKDFGTLPPRSEVEKYRAYIIGHPKQSPLSVSIQDNRMLDLDDRVLHYRTPTESGNSGSPVFNEDWELIALHRKGLKDMDRLNGTAGVYEANEGIRMNRILDAIAAEFGPPDGHRAEMADVEAPAPTVSPAPDPDAASPTAGRRSARTICDLDLRSTDVRDTHALEPGDLVVFRTQGNWISKLITSLDGYWSHSAIYVGDGDIVHAYAGGIGRTPVADLLPRYEGGAAVARPKRAREERAAAAAAAIEFADRMPPADKAYSGRDLGLAFTLLCRIKLQQMRERMMDMGEDDEGLEGLFRRAEFERTCSGFVYECYRDGPGALEIVPAPGLVLENGLLRVVRDADHVGASLEAILNESDADGLEGFQLPSAAKLRLLAEAGIGIAKSFTDGDRVPIEKGVTPADLWCSPEMTERWFLDAAGRTLAIEASAHCPV